MRFLLAVKMENYKSFQRTSTKLIGIFFILPIFYGIGYVSGSKAVTISGSFSAITFGSMCWALLGMTGITNVLFVILIANYFAREKEEGQLKFLLLKVNSRRYAFWAKCCSVLILIVSSYVLMYVISIVVYYFTIASGNHGLGLAEGVDDFRICLSTDFLYLIQLIMVSSIEILACMYYKSSTSMLIGIVASLIFTVLQYVSIIKYADPSYIVDLFNNSKISSLGVAFYGIVYMTICMAILIVSEKKFERIEIM